MLIRIKNTLSARKEYEAHREKTDPNWLTRRELMAKGILTTSFTLLVPGIVNMFLANSAKAAGAYRKFVCLDLAGGSGFGPEVVNLNRNLGFLTSYSTLGNPSNPNTDSNNNYGAYLWTNGLLYQALQAAETAEPALVGALKICVGQHSNSQDDSGNNKVLISHHAAKLAGIINPGLRIKTGLSNRNSSSGGNAQTIMDLAGYKPSVGNSVAAVTNLLNVAQGEMDALKTRAPNGPGEIFKLASAITKEGRTRMHPKDDGGHYADSYAQGLADNRTGLSTILSIDPRVDTDFQSAYGIAGGTAVNDPLVIEAANMKALFDGYASHVIMTDGGYDYHDNTDGWKAGAHTRMISRTMRILRAAARKNESCIVAWITDGGIQYEPTTVARGDSNERHSFVLFVLSKNGAPTPVRNYIGGYTNGQTADATNNPLQSNPSNEGYSLLATLLEFNGVSDLTPWLPPNMSVAEFKSLSFFSPA